MQEYRRKTSLSVTEYAPIARAVCKLDSVLEQRLVRKFEVAYTIAKEGIAFSKMASFCDSLEQQGVDLGEGYKTNVVWSTVVDYVTDLR